MSTNTNVNRRTIAIGAVAGFAVAAALMAGLVIGMKHSPTGSAGVSGAAASDNAGAVGPMYYGTPAPQIASDQPVTSHESPPLPASVAVDNPAPSTGGSEAELPNGTTNSGPAAVAPSPAGTSDSTVPTPSMSSNDDSAAVAPSPASTSGSTAPASTPPDSPAVTPTPAPTTPGGSTGPVIPSLHLPPCIISGCIDLRPALPPLPVSPTPIPSLPVVPGPIFSPVPVPTIVPTPTTPVCTLPPILCGFNIGSVFVPTVVPTPPPPVCTLPPMLCGAADGLTIHY